MPLLFVVNPVSYNAKLVTLTQSDEVLQLRQNSNDAWSSCKLSTVLFQDIFCAPKSVRFVVTLPTQKDNNWWSYYVFRQKTSRRIVRHADYSTAVNATTALHYADPIPSFIWFQVSAMLSFAKDKSNGSVLRVKFFVNANQLVMRRRKTASANTFGLPEQEAFDIGNTGY